MCSGPGSASLCHRWLGLAKGEGVNFHSFNSEGLWGQEYAGFGAGLCDNERHHSCILVFKQRQGELQTVGEEERTLTVSSYVRHPLECLVFGLRYV